MPSPIETVAKPPRLARALRELPDFSGPPLDVRRPVLFVPGFLTTYIHSAMMRKRLQSFDFEVYNLSLPRFAAGSLEHSARELKRKVEEIGILLDAEGIRLVCFGAGGLAARYYAESLGGATRIERAVMLATPHHGSRLAWLGAWAPAAREMMRDADFLEDLRKKEDSGHPVLGSYANVFTPWDGVVIPSGSCALKGADNLKLGWVCPHSALLWSQRVLQVVMDALAETRSVAGSVPEARQARARFQEISEFVAENPGEAGAFFSRGTLLAEHGHWGAAIRDLDRAIQLRPDFTEALYLRAQAFSRKLRYDENPLQCQAIRDFNLVIKAKPGHVEAYHQRGVCYALLSDWRAAVDSWDQVLILNRDYFPAYLARGLGHIRLGEPDMARDDLREVLRLQPDNAEAARLLQEL